MHSWLECVRGIARLPLSCLSPRDAKSSHDTAGIRIGVGMGTGYGEGMGEELSRKHLPLGFETGLFSSISFPDSHTVAVD